MIALPTRTTRTGRKHRPSGSHSARRLASTWQYAKWALVLMLLPVATLAAGQQANEVKAWLDRISQASQRHSYQGTFVYRCESNLMAMRVVHAASNDGPQERLVSLSGPAHEIMQSADRVTAVVASNRKHIVRGRPAGGVVGQPLHPGAVMEGIYEVSEAGSDRVAGRPTRLLRIAPRDRYRHGFQLWLDGETGIVLRSDMYNSAGDTIEQVMFTEIEYVPLDQALAALAGSDGLKDGQAASGGEPQVSAVPPSAWRVERAPEGFELADRYLSDANGGNEQLVFSDGLASVSVFIEPKDSQRSPFTGSAQIGAMAAFGRVVNGYQVTVVGEVPIDTVEMIAESLRHHGNQ